MLALTRVFDPRVIRIAACCAIVLSFCPKFAAVIAAMPACVIGGVSLVLYGMISAVGVRNLIENQVDFQNNRNVLVAALVLVLSLGIAYSTAGAIVLELGGVTISLSALPWARWWALCSTPSCPVMTLSLILPSLRRLLNSSCVQPN